MAGAVPFQNSASFPLIEISSLRAIAASSIPTSGKIGQKWGTPGLPVYELMLNNGWSRSFSNLRGIFSYSKSSLRAIAAASIPTSGKIGQKWGTPGFVSLLLEDDHLAKASSFTA